MPLHTTAIRDPLYNYIYVTPIEKLILDMPEVQRLRFILQNSAAYLTYPSNNNSRFLHSLGVMHLAGEVMLNSLCNAEQETLHDFLDHFANLVTKTTRYIVIDKQEIISDWDNCLGNTVGPIPLNSIKCFLYATTHNTEDDTEDDTEEFTAKNDSVLLINILWQSVRVAALLHDIGHFPLSHIFETAFLRFIAGTGEKSQLHKEFIKKRNKLLKDIDNSLVKELKNIIDSSQVHEVAGAILFHKWTPKATKTNRKFYDLIFRLAKNIFLVRPEPFTDPGEPDDLQIYRCLHAIIAGEIDVDRLDYCVRDPHSSGLELGAIDVQRITTSMTLWKSDTGHFVIWPNIQALSAIESFYHQRYLIYQYLVFHHNVSRFNGVAEEILMRLFREADKVSRKTTSGLNGVMKEFGFFQNVSGSGYGFMNKGAEIYDDAWLRTFFTQCLHKLKDLKTCDVDDAKELILLLDTFLYRRTENLLSMWKREADYDDTYGYISNKINQDPQGPEITKDIVRVVLSNRLFLNQSPPSISVAINNIKVKLNKHGVSLIVRNQEHRIPDIIKSSKQTASNFQYTTKILCKNKGDDYSIPKDLIDVSSYLSSLGNTQPHPPMFLAFIKKDLKYDYSIQKECRNIVLDELTDFVKTIATEYTIQNPVTI